MSEDQQYFWINSDRSAAERGRSVEERLLFDGDQCLLGVKRGVKDGSSCSIAAAKFDSSGVTRPGVLTPVASLSAEEMDMEGDNVEDGGEEGSLS